MNNAEKVFDGGLHPDGKTTTGYFKQDSYGWQKRLGNGAMDVDFEDIQLDFNIEEVSLFTKSRVHIN